MDINTILRLIQESKVTTEDFNNLISETTPESIRDRVRRRTLKSKTKPHIDKKTGHQSLSLPSFTKRVAPKRKPANQQNHGRSKIAHRHSERTQARKYFNEAIFIQNNINKEITESDIANLNKKLLNALCIKLLALPEANRDWLYKLLKMTK